MLTKGAIGNLVNRYKAVLKKCNLINTFGSLAVASMLVLGGAGVAEAETMTLTADTTINKIQFNNAGNVNTDYFDCDLSSYSLNIENTEEYITGKNQYAVSNSSSDTSIERTINIRYIDENKKSSIKNGSFDISSLHLTAMMVSGDLENSITAKNVNITSGGKHAIYLAENENTKFTINAYDVNIKSSSLSENTIQAAGGSTLTIIAENSVNIESDQHTALRTAAAEVKIKAKKLTLTTNSTSDEHSDDRSAVATWEGSSLTFDVEEATFNGDVDSVGEFIAQGKFNLNGKSNKFASVENLAEDSTIEFILSDKEAIVEIQQNEADNLGVTGVAGLTDTLQGDITQLAYQVKINQGAEGTTLKLCESDIFGESTAKLSEDGTVDKSSIQTKRNGLMDDILKLASVSTVSLDRILTNDVRKRLGDIRSDANTTGVWMRWDGGKLKGDSSLTNDFNTIQIGGDTKVAKNCRLGVSGSFTHGDTDFARGNGELEGFSFAAYATWMGENGMFADVVARLGHFSTEMNVEGRTGDMDNRVASLSGEYGWRFTVCDQFFVEPQVELAYTYVSSDDLELGDTKYSFDNVDSLTGRAGLVAGWNLPDDRGNVYARASVVQQFMGDARISGTKGIAHNVQEIDGEDTWLEYGIGANVKLTDSTYIWADVERTEGADIDEEWRGTVGIRYSF